MTFVFAFLGEFGYELLNWQGIIRKFSRALSPADSIVCCSRANLYPLYEMADRYIDVSEVTLFKHSQACCYSAIVPGSRGTGSWLNRAFDSRLRASVTSFVLQQLQATQPKGSHRVTQAVSFVFSSSKTELGRFTFGCDPNRVGEDGDIYERLDVGANLYQKIEPDLRLRREIEQRVGFSLSEPYVLIQTRARHVVVRSKEMVPKEDLIGALAEKVRVVLLSFASGRRFDSFSRFDSSLLGVHYAWRSFAEQACLVDFARHCVFFTEGDFGSHMLVPPFMGKDVVAIAPRSVYGLGDTPIDFWNRNVFRFGGQIVPKISEEVFASRRSLMELADEILSR